MRRSAQGSRGGNGAESTDAGSPTTLQAASALRSAREGNRRADASGPGSDEKPQPEIFRMRRTSPCGGGTHARRQTLFQIARIQKPARISETKKKDRTIRGESDGSR